MLLNQARRQDSVTEGGGRNKFWGALDVYLWEFERGTRAREIYSSVDQTNEVKTKKKAPSVQKFPQILVIVSKFLRFFTNSLVKTKKRSLSQKFYEIRCKSTKVTKIRAVNTNFGVLGLDLHSNNPEPVNFFGAQSSLGGGGGTSSHLGGTAPECPPWRRACTNSFVVKNSRTI